jgi:hypothetical protein
MPGYFKVERDFLDSDFWLSEPFTKPQAWVDLFGTANHAPGYFVKRGIKIPLKRSQNGRSELTLASRWKWSRNKVRRFLKGLEKEKSISLKQDNKTSIITICNYEIYQGYESKDETPNDTPERHQKDTKRNTNNNVDNVKKKKIINKPENVTDQTWNDFLIHRKEKKAKVTQTVINTFTEEAEKAGYSLEKALKETMHRGWQGFKADWVKKDSGKQQSQYNDL